MTLLIFVLILLFMFYLSFIGKKRREQQKLDSLSSKDRQKIKEIEKQRREEQDQKLITTILPTIINDGK